MDFQGFQTALEVGTVHDHPAVKTAGTQQRLIQDLGSVGGCQNHHALGGIEAVDLTQQLVQGLVVGHILGITAAAHCIDFIDKNDAGRHFGGLLEQVPHTAGTHAHEHIVKAGAGNGEEGHPRLTGYCLGDQGLTGTGRAHQQHTLGQLGTDFRVFLGIVEEVDDLHQRLLGLILARHIPKGNAGLLFHVDLDLAAAEAAGNAVTAHAFGDHAHHQEEHRKHQHVEQNADDPGIILHNGLIDLHAHGIQFPGQGQVIAEGKARKEGLLFFSRLPGLFFGHVNDPVCAQLHFSQLIGFQQIPEVGVSFLLILAVSDGVEHKQEQQQKRCRYNKGHPQAAAGTLFAASIGARGTVVGVLIHFLTS